MVLNFLNVMTKECVPASKMSLVKNVINVLKDLKVHHFQIVQVGISTTETISRLMWFFVSFTFFLIFLSC